MIRTGFLMCALFFLWPGAASSQESAVLKDGWGEKSPTASPRLLHYQVRLTESDGVPLAGTVKLVIRIYKTAEDGSLLWAETQNAVPLIDGVASVLLGSLVTLPNDLFDSSERYLGLTVNDGAEMVPRLRIGAVPYAMEAARLEGKTAAEFEPKGAVLALAINDGSPPNSGTNRVHWNNLTGLPDGFVDGVDNGVSTHSDLSGLEGDDHPQYALETELEASSGSGPNSGKNLVHWENLVGVPTGFADGADNTGPGVILHGDLLELEEDDHPQYATDLDFVDHTSDMDLHGTTQSAGDLTSGTLSPDRIAEGSLDGTKIQDGSLSSGDLGNESGVIYLTGAGEDSLEAAPKDLIMASIQCPDTGWVLVVATAQACVDSGEVNLEASFSVSATSNTMHAPAEQFFDINTDQDRISCLPVTSQTVFSVSAGLQTFYLVAKSDAPGIRASRYSLSVVYLPTQY